MGRRRILEQQVVEKRGGLAVQIEQAPLALAFLVRLGIGFLLADLHAGPAGEFAHRLHERQVLVIPHKRDGVPALAAAETMERLPRRIDIKRRRFLMVKRTVRPELRTRPLQGQIRPDQLDDIRRAENLFDAFLGNLGHGFRCAATIRPAGPPDNTANHENPPAITELLAKRRRCGVILPPGRPNQRPPPSTQRALSSVVEHILHTDGVAGSKPAARTRRKPPITGSGQGSCGCSHRGSCGLRIRNWMPRPSTMSSAVPDRRRISSSALSNKSVSPRSVSTRQVQGVA